MTFKTLSSLLLCISISVMSLHAQQEKYYRVKASKEIPLLLTGAGLTGLGYGLKLQIEPLSEATVGALDTENIPGFDRFATRYWSLSLSKTSDYLLNSSLLLPGLLALDAKGRKEFGSIGIMWLETLLLNEGITSMGKSLGKRKRPFVYNPEVAYWRKSSLSAQRSFFSGHTSATAASCFFFAQVFADLYPRSPYRPWIWGIAISLPATVGFLRVRSGRHFLSDVIAGYGIGAFVGMLIPRMHKANIKNLDISPGLQGLSLRYSF